MFPELVATGIVIALGYLLVVKLPKRWRLLQRLKVYTGPPSFPIVGNLELNVDRGEVLKVLENWVNQYGRRILVFLGLQPYIMLSNASDVERVLTSQTQIEKSNDYELFYSWLGISLLTSGGKLWFHRRKQLTPAFHFKILEDFIRVFNEQCTTLKSVLEKKGDLTFDLFPVITHCALDIICETAMGRKINAQQKSDSDYVTATYKMSQILQYRVLRPWLHPDIVWRLTERGREEKQCLKILHAFSEAAIKERKQWREEKKKADADKLSVQITDEDEGYSKKRRLAFLDLLLEAQDTDPTLTDRNLREETDTFTFEGHDTTSAGVCWTSFLLACNPEAQAKVHEELDRIFGNDKERDVTLADVAEMKYLECCIKEGLRVFPSVPFIGRKLTSELELGDGSKIPEGCTIWILLHFLHRDPSVFPDPEKFDPNRFLPENIQGRNPFAYTPFSAGPRNCIGQKFAMMEEKVILATIFRNFRMIAVDKREDVVVLSEVITRPQDGLHVRLEKR